MYLCVKFRFLRRLCVGAAIVLRDSIFSIIIIGENKKKFHRVCSNVESLITVVSIGLFGWRLSSFAVLPDFAKCHAVGL